MSYQYSLELTNKWTKKQIHHDNKLFKKRSSVTASKVGDGLDPPSKKKKQDNKKRNKEYGYCEANISEEIEKMKDSEAGKWRIINKLKVSYTIITRDWEYRNKK